MSSNTARSRRLNGGAQTTLFMFLLVLAKNIIVSLANPPEYTVWMLTMFEIAFGLVLLMSVADYINARIARKARSLIWG